MIDSDHNPRILDFGYSQTLSRQDQLEYLWNESIRPGARMWTAPERLRPDLYPDLKDKHMLKGDIYSLGCIILFVSVFDYTLFPVFEAPGLDAQILSGNHPWTNGEFEKGIEERSSPPRPLWPPLAEDVWCFIKKCWSPRAPEKRPSAGEVLSFTRDRLEQLLQPTYETSTIILLIPDP